MINNYGESIGKIVDSEIRFMVSSIFDDVYDIINHLYADKQIGDDLNDKLIARLSQAEKKYR